MLKAMINQIDTIAALATPAGRGGIGVIRISGPQVSHIAESLLGKLPKPRQATFNSFINNDGEGSRYCFVFCRTALFHR